MLKGIAFRYRKLLKAASLKRKFINLYRNYNFPESYTERVKLVNPIFVNTLKTWTDSAHLSNYHRFSCKLIKCHIIRCTNSKRNNCLSQHCWKTVIKIKSINSTNWNNQASRMFQYWTQQEWPQTYCSEFRNRFVQNTDHRLERDFE